MRSLKECRTQADVLDWAMLEMGYHTDTDLMDQALTRMTELTRASHRVDPRVAELESENSELKRLLRMIDPIVIYEAHGLPRSIQDEVDAALAGSAAKTATPQPSGEVSDA